MTASDYWAVGEYTDESSLFDANGVDDERFQPLIEQYTGSGWAIVASPSIPVADGYGSGLASVTCVTASDCWAVGGSASDSSGGPLIEQYTGSGWNIVPSPDPGQPYGMLNSVACAGASDCWAVGSVNGQGALVEQYTGTGWSIVTTPTVGDGGSLSGVTCVSASDCIAVGYYNGTSSDETLIEQDTGAGWSVVPSANVPLSPGANSGFQAITCTGPGDCWIVGTDNASNNVIEQNTGDGWSLVTTPSSAESLQSVTCVTTADCSAVGNDGDWHALMEQNTGSGWRIVSSPNPSGGTNSQLFDVACVSADECWAVGATGNGGGSPSQILIEGTRGSGA